MVSVYAGGNGGTSSGYSIGLGTAAMFSSPFGIAFDSSGSLIVADTGNHRIRTINDNGTTV